MGHNHGVENALDSQRIFSVCDIGAGDPVGNGPNGTSVADGRVKEHQVFSSFRRPRHSFGMVLAT